MFLTGWGPRLHASGRVVVVSVARGRADRQSSWRARDVSVSILDDARGGVGPRRPRCAIAGLRKPGRWRAIRCARASTWAVPLLLRCVQVADQLAVSATGARGRFARCAGSYHVRKLDARGVAWMALWLVAAGAVSDRRRADGRCGGERAVRRGCGGRGGVRGCERRGGHGDARGGERRGGRGDGLRKADAPGSGVRGAWGACGCGRRGGWCGRVRGCAKLRQTLLARDVRGKCGFVRGGAGSAAGAEAREGCERRGRRRAGFECAGSCERCTGSGVARGVVFATRMETRAWRGSTWSCVPASALCSPGRRAAGRRP